MYLPDCQSPKENKQEERIYFIKTHLLIFPSKKGVYRFIKNHKEYFFSGPLWLLNLSILCTYLHRLV